MANKNAVQVSYLGNGAAQVVVAIRNATQLIERLDMFQPRIGFRVYQHHDEGLHIFLR